MILKGDHAGVSETSLMLYFDKKLVDMHRIRETNCQEHTWQANNSPEKATYERGESEFKLIVNYLKQEIEKALNIKE